MHTGFYKYFWFIINFWIFSGLSAQNEKAHEYAVFLLNKAGIAKEIDSTFQKQQFKYVRFFQEIKNQNKDLFTKAKDSVFVMNQIDNLIKFEKNNIWDRMVFQKKSKGKKALKKIVRHSAKDTNVLLNLRKKYRMEIQNFARESYINFKQIHLPEYIKIIKGQKSPIPVNIFIKGIKKESFPKNFEMFLLIKNKEVDKIPIINSQKNAIIKNPVENYNNIYALMITYQNHNFILLPDKTHLKMPGQFKMIKNFLSKINFIKDNPWNIYIDETPEKIIISLENTGFAKAESKKLMQE